ncbi:MAG: hypothetical protein Q4G27_06990 [Flavobacteriaceae bacterium]|nr:hypothetical protein [Flavobacteriaceae bacterium]
MPSMDLRNITIFVFCGLLLCIGFSCRKDLEFETSSSALRFSKDTVFLDTIFTRSNSETYLLKVYNPSQQDISLSEIYLNKRFSSAFRINVDGRSGFEFANIPLRAQDSLMIFVEAAIDTGNQDWIEEDEIVFTDSNQKVKLLALAEESTYYYAASGDDFLLLNNDTEWNNSSSRVIYGHIKLAPQKRLTIHEGTKVYFHHNSSLTIESGASLHLNGSLEQPIVIRGDRHDARYDTLPKQWNSIRLNEAELITNHAVIKGGTQGLNLINSTAQIHNTQIYNMSSSGILAVNSEINASNLVISDAGDACLKVEKGGNYNFYYSSFANNWVSGAVGISGYNIPAYLSNYRVLYDANGIETGTEYGDLNAFFANCIFYGKYPNGVVLDQEGSQGFNFNFQNCLIKNENTNEFDFSSFHPLTENPDFVSTIFSRQDLRLNENSPARNQGNSTYNSYAPRDIKGNLRDNTPNMGAYE